MTTYKFTRNESLHVVLSEAAQDIFTRLLQSQQKIVSEKYLRRQAPHLDDFLAAGNFNQCITDDGLNVLITYQLTIRFLNLKKIKGEKSKTFYGATCCV